ncbi:MAG: TlpA family protein disulfide reductase [Nitrospirae bacterium]|nr:TlpA family protein disulfide reductase [Candidatus Manganitrophaceae bacterium]
MGLRLRTPILPIAPVAGWLNSGPIDVAAHGAAVTLLHFWALSCPLCKDQMPAVVQWLERYGPRGLRVIGVHTPLVETDKNEVMVERMVRAFKLTHPIVLDQEGVVASTYQVDAVPTYFLYDRNLLLRYRHTGSQATAPVTRMIERLLNEAEQEERGDRRAVVGGN